MSNAKRFEGQVALITGGGSGIGQACALRLAEEGAAIGIADISSDKAQETLNMLKSKGGRGLVVEADVTKTDDCERMIQETVNQLGRLDILLPFAGIGGSGSVVDITEEMWDRMLNLDLKGVYLCCKFAIPEIRKAGKGAIVLVSSLGGLRGNFGAHFCAAKGAIVNLTRSMAVAHAQENIRVNCVCPGYIATPIIQRVLDDPELRKEVGNCHPMGRMGEAEEVAAAVAFLASDDASFITGAIVPVDGGYLAAGK